MRLVVVVLVCLALIVSGVYTIFKITEPKNNSTQSGPITVSNEDAVSVFNPLSTESSSYVAFVSGRTKDGKFYTATIEHDSNGNTHYQGTLGSDTFEIYQIDNKNIVCNKDTCIESPGGDGSPIDEEQFEYNEQDYVEFKETAKYLGRDSCASGTCDTWEIEEDNNIGELFINAEGRVNRAEWEGSDGTFNIDYEYQDVQIEVPENSQPVSSN